MKIKHYCPSNGTEGMWFEDMFCDICSKLGKDGNPPHCIIWGDMMIGKQRDEWCYVDKKPTCTAFQSRRDSQNDDKKLIKSGQTYF